MMAAWKLCFRCPAWSFRNPRSASPLKGPGRYQWFDLPCPIDQMLLTSLGLRCDRAGVTPARCDRDFRCRSDAAARPPKALSTARESAAPFPCSCFACSIWRCAFVASSALSRSARASFSNAIFSGPSVKCSLVRDSVSAIRALAASMASAVRPAGLSCAGADARRAKKLSRGRSGGRG